jgi:hypothetical protein
MNGRQPETGPLPGEPAAEEANTVPRSGNGADTALLAMLRRRQMRAGAEPQPPQPDGKNTRKK